MLLCASFIIVLALGMLIGYFTTILFDQFHSQLPGGFLGLASAYGSGTALKTIIKPGIPHQYEIVVFIWLAGFIVGTTAYWFLMIRTPYVMKES